MARKLQEQLEIFGSLKACSPLHIGGAMEDLSIDMPVALDGKGEHFIPGTSLAGAVSSWWKKNFVETHEGETHAKVWGDTNKYGASLITVADAPITKLEGLELRDGVGIDRHTGAAANSAKFDHQLVAIGAVFNFKLFVDVPPETSERAIANFKGMIRAMVDALTKGEISLGAGRSVGQGRMILETPKFSRRNFGDLEKLIASLGNTNGEVFSDDNFGIAAKISAQSTITITLYFETKLSTFSESGTQGLAVDCIPFARPEGNPQGNKVIPVITGRSIKGVWRSHAERIARTFAVEKPNALVDKISLLNQTIENGLVAKLFGARKGNTDNKIGRGMLEFEDCVVGKPLDIKAYQSLFSFDSAEKKDRAKNFREVLSPTVWKDALPYVHNAVDRWTGGTLEGALYSVLELPTIKEGTITVKLDRERLDGDFDAALGFALLLVREAFDGQLPMGFGTNRGHGTIAVQKATISGLSEDAIKLEAESFDQEFDGSLELAASAWAKHKWTVEKAA